MSATRETSRAVHKTGRGEQWVRKNAFPIIASAIERLYRDLTKRARLLLPLRIRDTATIKVLWLSSWPAAQLRHAQRLAPPWEESPDIQEPNPAAVPLGIAIQHVVSRRKLWLFPWRRPLCSALSTATRSAG